ncbi:MAG: alkaline phosphatase D family protein [Proteobacteria bacterium]|nr:alkaline phosphatase D family protein [Pseudomonadota bacterium]
MPAPLRRRSLLQATGASLGALSLRGFAIDKPAAAHFTHGIASGDPLADRVILWTRVLPGSGNAAAVACTWQVATDDSFDTVVAGGEATARAERDYTVKVDAAGLTPGTSYCYRFMSHGVTSPVGCTRTLPVGAVSEFKMAVASCSNYPQGFFHAYRDIAKSELDVVLHLGDYLYEYPVGEYVNPVAEETLGRKVEPEHEILVLEDYRMRHGLYRTDPDLLAAHAAHPWITVWDDHEMMNDTWRAGAENHDEGEGDFFERIHAARQAYHEWMPIRTGAEGDQGVIYRAFQVGDLADLIMLDTRLVGRDQQLNYGRDIEPAGGLKAFIKDHLNAAERQLLGAAQEQWLQNAVQSSKARGATWQLLGQQVLMGKLNIPVIPPEELAKLELSEYARPRVEQTQQLAPYGLPSNLDAWDGYPAARERLFAMLGAHATNPISLAGDTHNGWAFNLTNQKGEAVGVEWGTPGVSSPGLENYVPLPPDQMQALLKGASPELVACDTAQRGWTHVTLTPEAATAQWRFVSSVTEPTYQTSAGEPLVTLRNARKLA